MIQNFTLFGRILQTAMRFTVFLRRKNRMWWSTSLRRAMWTVLLKIRRYSWRPMSWEPRYCWMPAVSMVCSAIIRSPQTKFTETFLWIGPICFLLRKRRCIRLRLILHPRHRQIFCAMLISGLMVCLLLSLAVLITTAPISFRKS